MSDRAHPTEGGPPHRWVELGVAVLTLLFGAVVILGSLQVGIDWGIEGPRPGFFPFYIALCIMIGSLVNLVQAWNGNTKEGEFSSWEQLRRVMAVVVPSVGYVALVPLLGIYVSSMLLIGVFMIWLGGYRVWLTAPIAVGVPVLAYLVFERYFQIPLPKGPIEYGLGL
jgi:hypothetical protein